MCAHNPLILGSSPSRGWYGHWIGSSGHCTPLRAEVQRRKRIQAGQKKQRWSGCSQPRQLTSTPFESPWKRAFGQIASLHRRLQSKLAQLSEAKFRVRKKALKPALACRAVSPLGLVRFSFLAVGSSEKPAIRTPTGSHLTGPPTCCVYPALVATILVLVLIYI